MSPSPRISPLNANPILPGQYVLYWMQASQRATFNHALERAALRANHLNLPLLVAFGLTDDYPEANLRHYTFMLQGLADTAAALRRRGILLVIRRGSPPDVALELSRAAAAIVCDRGYLRHQRRWRADLASRANQLVEQVESDIVVPVAVASNKQEYAARTLRPRIHRVWKNYLLPLRPVKLKHSSLALDIPSDIDLASLDAALAALSIDRSVPPSPRFTGGPLAARRLLDRFLRQHLAGYAQDRREPAAGATSTLAAYLHFGQISPLEIALKVLARDDAPQADRDAFIEELIIRRELAINYVYYNDRYDHFDALPAWARHTLAHHRADPRPYLYTRSQLESAQTHDPYWNAAQLEMVRTGYMHNSMRMYWGKKVLEWKSSPASAFADLLYLNNKYFLCGRDPSAYANVAWIFGLHDRPWPPRPIFGTVRYMNSSGLTRKFNMPAYLHQVDHLPL